MSILKSMTGKGVRAVALVLLWAALLPSANAADGNADPAAFARGAKAWAENCSRCHNMRDPKDYRDDQWRAVVGHMRVRAGLTGQEARDILLFLQRSN